MRLITISKLSLLTQIQNSKRLSNMDLLRKQLNNIV